MDLYIATRSDRGDIVKIGRSNDARARCTALQASQAFWVDPTVIFTGQGFRETEIHQALKKRRIEGVPSREWFNYTLPEAVQAVGGQLYSTPGPTPGPPDLPGPPAPEVPDVRPHLEFVRAPRFASTAAEVEAVAADICGEAWKAALVSAGLTRRRGKIGGRHAYRYQAVEGWVKTSVGRGLHDPNSDDEADSEFTPLPDDGEALPNDEPAES